MSAIMVKEFNVPFPIALIIGGTFAGLCSFIIGYPAFRSRLRGDYFAIATLGFSESIRLLLNNVKALGSITLGGAFGYMNIPSHTDVLVVVITVLLALFFAHMFVTSQYGKNCIAISQDEVAAQMMGVNLLKTKLTRFVHQRLLCWRGRRTARLLFCLSQPIFLHHHKILRSAGGGCLWRHPIPDRTGHHRLHPGNGS